MDIGRRAAPVQFRRLLVLWLHLQLETTSGWLNLILQADLSGLLGASYTASCILLFLDLDCQCLFVTSSSAHQVRVEIVSTVRRHRRHLQHLFYLR